MMTSTVIGILVIVLIICSMVATILVEIVSYEMRFGKELYSDVQIRRARQTLWTLAICAAAIIDSFFMLWVINT
jgi:hypothetical protein